MYMNLVGHRSTNQQLRYTKLFFFPIPCVNMNNLRYENNLTYNLM